MLIFLIFQDRFDILLEMRLSGVAEPFDWFDKLTTGKLNAYDVPFPFQRLRNLYLTFLVLHDTNRSYYSIRA